MAPPPPRIPPLPADQRDPRTQEILDDLGQSMGAELNIFSTLARHPRLLKRWAAFGGVLLYGARLSDRDRELLIMRTGYNCRARYEWGQHVAFCKAAGMTDDEIARIASGPDADGWSTHDATLLRAADELHATSRLSDATWTALTSVYDEQQMIEVCMLVGQYHLVAFTLNSLGVEPEDGLPEMPA